MFHSDYNEQDLAWFRNWIKDEEYKVKRAAKRHEEDPISAIEVRRIIAERKAFYNNPQPLPPQSKKNRVSAAIEAAMKDVAAVKRRYAAKQSFFTYMNVYGEEV